MISRIVCLCWRAGGRRTRATENKPKIACGRRQWSVWLAVLLASAGFTSRAEVGPGEPIPIVLAAAATFKAENLRCEYLKDPLGIDVTRPRLSWELRADGAWRSTMREKSATRVPRANRSPTARVRPSSGAAGFDPPSSQENPDTILLGDVAAPGDGRTPGQSPAIPRGVKQRAYQVLVASSPELLKTDRGDLWDSGKVESDQSVHVEYTGKPLGSRQGCWWKVRVWGQDRKPSPWSSAARWSMGLLTREDWTGKWIGLDGGEEAAGSLKGVSEEARRLPARYLRRQFQVEKKVKRATAYVCGLGFFELYLNGRRISDHVMDPGLSNYSKRDLYVTFDVTEYLKAGANAVGVILGNGRFFAPRSKVPFPTPTFGYPKLLLHTSVEYEDGSVTELVTDERWKITANGPIRANNEFDGEEYDARREMAGWSEAGFKDDGWQPAQLVKPPEGRLLAQMFEPMRVTGVLKPVAITNPKPGVYLADFGQNLYGAVRLKVRGPAGTRVQLRTSFTRQPDGTIKMEDNRSARSTDLYILRGGGEEVWAPRFRGQGTHYAEVTGWPGVPAADNFELLVIHTDLEQAGDFACSNDLLNRIYANIVRSARMQERSAPLDPDRDERQPWLGHPAKTSESEAYLFNVAPFYLNFLAETRADQRADGNLSDGGSVWDMYSGNPIWPSVVTILPDWAYHFYGDRRFVEQNYEMARKWMLFQQQHSLGWDFTAKEDGYGDWVDAASMDGRGPDSGATSRSLMNTAYICHNCRIVARLAALLGRTDDAAFFSGLAEKVRAGFHQRFFDPKTATYESQTECSYTLPLAFDLVPPEFHAAVVSNFVAEIMAKHEGHTTVGLTGMQWFMQVLTDIGHPEVAYTVATRTNRPSWGYMLSKGASSVWERWDQDTRDPGMNGESQMILAGNLVAWLYQTLAGINCDPAQPGFKHIILRPRPVGDLSFVKAWHKCLYGSISSSWEREGGQFTLKVTIPPNTSATIYVPAKNAARVMESGQPANKSKSLRFLRMEDGNAVFEASSGHYSFWSLL